MVGVDSDGLRWFVAWSTENDQRDIVVYHEELDRAVAHGSFVIREAVESVLMGRIIERPTTFVLRTVVDKWDYGPAWSTTSSRSTPPATSAVPGQLG